MVPYEAFACRCGDKDVVLRESYKPKTRGKRVCLVVGFVGALTTPNYSPGPSTPPSYSSGPSRNAECANCQLLIGKLQVLEPTLEMYMHPEKHTIDSTALLQELYNDMGKFRKLRLLDNNENPLVPTGIIESDSEVEVVFDETANLRISTSGKNRSDKGYGTNSLLEQWRDSYPYNDDYDPYDDDISSLLSRETLPDVKNAFAIISREESHKAYQKYLLSRETLPDVKNAFAIISREKSHKGDKNTSSKGNAGTNLTNPGFESNSFDLNGPRVSNENRTVEEQPEPYTRRSSKTTKILAKFNDYVSIYALPFKISYEYGFKGLRHLKGSSGTGLQFNKLGDFKLKVYYDYDWVKCPVTRESKYEYCVFFGSSFVSWKSKKQSTLSRSSVLRQSIDAWHLQHVNSAIQTAANPVFHEKTKHFEIDVYLIREKVASGVIETMKISSHNQIANIFTQGLDIAQHKKLCKELLFVNTFQLPIYYWVNSWFIVSEISREGYLEVATEILCTDNAVYWDVCFHGGVSWLETLIFRVVGIYLVTCITTDSEHLVSKANACMACYMGYQSTIGLTLGLSFRKLAAKAIWKLLLKYSARIMLNS
nr:hypothetical protein [Tanacetum cinerariifolium]